MILFCDKCDHPFHQQCHRHPYPFQFRHNRRRPLWRNRRRLLIPQPQNQPPHRQKRQTESQEFQTLVVVVMPVDPEKPVDLKDVVPRPVNRRPVATPAGQRLTSLAGA